MSWPVTVFGSLDDARSDRSVLEAWRQHTSARCFVRLVAGDRSFDHQQHLVVASILETLRAAVAR